MSVVESVLDEIAVTDVNFTEKKHEQGFAWIENRTAFKTTNRPVSFQRVSQLYHWKLYNSKQKNLAIL